MTGSVVLDGHSLTVEDVVAVARDAAEVRVSPDAAARASRSRAAIERAAAGSAPVYGVNTGFGKLASVRIPPDRLLELQRNLILSHCAGVGPPLPRPIVRAIMLLRANVLLQETSGARPVLAERLTQLLNAGIHPIVPEQGSVGASGDLAPLSHIARALLGDGDVEIAALDAEAGRRVSAGAALAEARLEPVVLQAKEGLSFINGTQAQSAMLALLLHDARNLWRSAHGAAAMSLEALRGTPVPFDARIHDARPHAGQKSSAALMRALLENSEIRESHRTNDPRVQDAYSLRCVPQVLGTVSEGLDFAERILAVELNAATDNPLVFGGELLSGGNFHGQPVALALDVLATVLTTLAGIAERRIEALVNPDLSQGLPAFLTPQAGLQSGYMMVQVTAAALVAECRTLCAPASVQSIPTDANQEDYVPMGMAAAMKARRVLANAQRVVAAELLCGAQGLEFLKPLEPGRGVADVYRKVRHLVNALEADRPITDDIERLAALLEREAIV
ncbi:MAG: histidine ammonia-lyase [Gemmatimonadetes bacterium]|nr:histidine ammonia-lyase [Gemmatimonadota bacterium]